MNDGTGKERLAKVMARAGLCSRRDAEVWIRDGRVMLNGAVWRDPAINVGADDNIVVNGKPLPKLETTRLWMLHKPAGFVTTAKDPEGRLSVFSLLPKTLPRVVSVGRLDLNSEGLLLLTNDGEFARTLELPATGLPRTYRVRIYGRFDPRDLTALKNGITIDGVRYGAIQAVPDRQGDANLNQWLTVTLHEGKNREIRRVMQHLGLHVSRLARIAYGPFEMGTLEPGQLIEIALQNIAIFKNELDRQHARQN